MAEEIVNEHVVHHHNLFERLLQNHLNLIDELHHDPNLYHLLYMHSNQLHEVFQLILQMFY
jgi:hypothetical protein